MDLLPQLGQLITRFRGRSRLPARFLDQVQLSQFDPPAVIRQRQFTRLVRLVRFAAEQSEFYRTLFAEHDIDPQSLRTPADFARIPVLTKAAYRANVRRMLADSFRHADDLFIKKTSGSTGIPLDVLSSEPSLRWKAACTRRADEWSGWRAGEPVAKVWGNPTYKKHGLKGRLHNLLVERAVYLDTLDVTPQRLREFVEGVNRLKPTLLFGHAHSIYLFARFAAEHAPDVHKPRAIISTAMALHDWQRRVIEQTFGCPVTNRYGAEETSVIACECEAHAGLHLNADNLYVETVDRDGRPVTGRPGFLVVTDLSNYAVPLVRYQLGDVAVISDRPCPCGRTLPLLERIEGREADYVVTGDGRWVSGISLTENFALEIPNIDQVQIIQESACAITLKVVRKPGFRETNHGRLRQLAAKLFGPATAVTVEFVDFIPPEPSGKFRFCISKVTGRDQITLNVERRTLNVERERQGAECH